MPTPVNSINEGTIGIVGFTGTGFTASPVTQYDVLVGSSTTSTIASVGPGSAGQVLQSGGNAANPAYSTATYPSTATSTGTILRADGTNWLATTSTYPNTNAINTLLYASSANVMSALATANGGVLSTSSSGVPSIDTTNFSVLSTGLQLKGNNTNTAPPAGFIGEEIRSVVTYSSPVSLPNVTPTNLTSISLTAGIWDVSLNIGFQGATAGQTIGAAISTTSADLTLGLGDNRIDFPFVSQAGSTANFTIPSYRLTLSTTTTVYAVAYEAYSAGTATVYGRISATRVG